MRLLARFLRESNKQGHSFATLNQSTRDVAEFLEAATHPMASIASDVVAVGRHLANQDAQPATSKLPRPPNTPQGSMRIPYGVHFTSRGSRYPISQPMWYYTMALARKVNIYATWDRVRVQLFHVWPNQISPNFSSHQMEDGQLGVVKAFPTQHWTDVEAMPYCGLLKNIKLIVAFVSRIGLIRKPGLAACNEVVHPMQLGG